VTSDRAFVGVSAAALAVSAAVTVSGAASMSAMPGMDMPGGWTMSMAWMRMPGQSWPGAAAAFLGMWAVMMVAMMLPVAAPRLLEYRRAGGAAGIAALAYFGMWATLGVVVYPLGLLLAEATMRWPALARVVPLLASVTVALAGAMQFSRWKQRALECCREAQNCCAPSRSAWRHGAELGLQCVRCCAGLTLVLLVLGVMDLRAMALVTGLIAVERLAPRGDRWARAIGAVLVVTGVGALVLSK
jgi:predicted metal-binding membrane protein